MAFAKGTLVHTDEGDPVESTGSAVEIGSTEPGTRSSAGEHPLHTGRVAGSIPAASTISLSPNKAEASPTRITDTSPEEWRSIRGFESVYEVSNHGRVRRLRGRSRRGSPGKVLGEPVVLTPYDGSGYPKYHLSYGAAKRRVYAHALVMDAFVGPRPAGREIAHLDGCRDNPALANLAYVTPLENNSHKRVHGTQKALAGPDQPKAVLTADQVREVRDLRRRRAMRVVEIARKFGISRETVYSVCNRTRYGCVQ